MEDNDNAAPTTTTTTITTQTKFTQVTHITTQDILTLTFNIIVAINRSNHLIIRIE